MISIIKRVINKIKRIYKIKSLNKRNDFNIDIKSNIEGSHLLGYNNIGRNTSIIDSELGKYSYVGANSLFFKAKIGKFCSIANNVKLVCGTHPTKNFVSTSPYFYKTNNSKIKSLNNDCVFEEYKYCDNEKKYFCEIGNDVWIGENVTILQGVKIGNGAIIGAGAVVTKNIADYAIVGGIPAKIIKYRFDEETIDFLNDLKWWDKDDEWLKKNCSNFDNVKKIKEDVSND